MVTRFAASLHTDNSPQRKETQTTVSRSDIRLIQYLDSSALGLVGPEVAILNRLFPCPLLIGVAGDPWLIRKESFRLRGELPVDRDDNAMTMLSNRSVAIYGGQIRGDMVRPPYPFTPWVNRTVSDNITVR
jgi:hypothetical protein